MGRQLNFTLSERYELALRTIAMRDEVALGEVIRPALEEHIDRELANDERLARSVDELLASRRDRKATDKPVADLEKHRAKRGQAPS